MSMRKTALAGMLGEGVWEEMPQVMGNMGGVSVENISINLAKYSPTLPVFIQHFEFANISYTSSP